MTASAPSHAPSVPRDRASLPRSDRYSTVAKALHWTIAALIIAQFVGGKFMTHLPLETDPRFLAYQFHKSFGFVVLSLALFRLYWRARHPVPPLPEGMGVWARRAARATHVGFYGLMIGVPLLGWFLVSASPVAVPTKIFFVLPVPHFPVPATEPVYGVFENLHALFATATIGLLVLHVGAALKHHYIGGDRVFLRMLPLRRGADGKWAVPILTGGLSLIALAYLIIMIGWGNEEDTAIIEAPSSLMADVPATENRPAADGGAEVAEASAATGWVIDGAATEVVLAGTAYGNRQEAILPEVTGTIRLDPEAPQEGLIDVSLPLGALDAGGAVVEQLSETGWFDIAAFPIARFRSEAISATPDGDYLAEGVLTVKGRDLPLTLPFALTVEGDRAAADGSVVVDRTVFGVGGDGGGIGKEVTVTIHVEAEQTP